MLNVRRFTALFGLAFVSQALSQVDPDFHIYLAFGQSNMEGYAKDFGANDKVSLPRFKVLGATTCSDLQRAKDQWSPGIAPLFRCNTGLSPADYFARTLVDSLPSTIKIGIVPVAIAGTPIEGFNPTRGKAFYDAKKNAQDSWMYQIAQEYGGDPYARLVALGKLAQKTGVIKGIILHQGESNGGDKNWPPKVDTVYSGLIKDLGLTKSQVPLLAGEIVTTTNPNDMNSIIRALPKTVSTSYVISSSGLATHANDGTKQHFSAASYREFGKRYAQQMLKLLPKSVSINPSKFVAFMVDANFVVYNFDGTRVGTFHATDAASLENGLSGIRSTLPRGIYWVKNATTGATQRLVNGI
jgi:hypothetical protein